MQLKQLFKTNGIFHKIGISDEFQTQWNNPSFPVLQPAWELAEACLTKIFSSQNEKHYEKYIHYDVYIICTDSSVIVKVQTFYGNIDVYKNIFLKNFHIVMMVRVFIGSPRANQLCFTVESLSIYLIMLICIFCVFVKLIMIFGMTYTHWFNTLRPRKMAAIFQTTFSKAFFWMKIYGCRLLFHWNLFLRVELTIFQYWFR